MKMPEVVAQCARIMALLLGKKHLLFSIYFTKVDTQSSVILLSWKVNNFHIIHYTMRVEWTINFCHTVCNLLESIYAFFFSFFRLTSGLFNFTHAVEIDCDLIMLQWYTTPYELLHTAVLFTTTILPGKIQWNKFFLWEKL